MTLSVCGRRQIFDHDWNPLKTIYEVRGLECDHSITTYAYTTGGIHIKEICVRCGHRLTNPLPYAEHPDRGGYPALYPRVYVTESEAREEWVEHISVKSIEIQIAESTESGGAIFPSERVWDQSCLTTARSVMLNWNEIIYQGLRGKVSWGILQALQYGLRNIVSGEAGHDDQDDDVYVVARMSVDFDLKPYVGIIHDLHRKYARRLAGLFLLTDTDQLAPEDIFTADFTYADWLQSNHWAERKLQAIKWNPNRKSEMRFSAVCESPSCFETHGIQCHHLTYINAGHEQPGDLIFLCRSCHENAEFMKEIARPQEISLR